MDGSHLVKHYELGSDLTERTAVSSLDFEAGYHDKGSDRLYSWTPPNQISPFEMELPQTATAWSGLYEASGVNQLNFVPCYFDGGGLFQKMDGAYLTLKQRDGKTVLLSDKEPPQEIFENLDFPNGYNDFVFIPTKDGVFAVEFGGRFIKLPSISHGTSH